jgi:methylmalonyl-CoA mutase cobalamin-binding subunit
MNSSNEKKIIGASIGDCVHVAGIMNFFRIAEDIGFETVFLGPAVSIEECVDAIARSDAKYVAISYRLTPDNGINYLQSFITAITNRNLTDRVYLLGALPALSEKAQKLDFFQRIFEGGESVNEVLNIFNQIGSKSSDKVHYASNLVDRIKSKAPFPVLRAHFGLPSMEDTVKGINHIAKSQALDVISIAPDQAAQEWLHRPETLCQQPEGSGGVPIRSKEDLHTLYQASRVGNKPLLRIYSGTQDLLKNGQWFHETLHNAWAAIPIFWYSELDGRGPSKLQDAIQEHFDAIRWHAKQGIPVEINDPHQWGLRMAPDHLVVAVAYLAAYVAKSLGVKTYVEQLMFNTPSGNTWKMDLARVLAMIEIVQPLIDENFKILKETRAGLAYLAPKTEVAKGQLAASTLLQMSVRPEILHIVSYCEADHAAHPEDIVDSAMLIQRVIQDAIHGIPDFSGDKEILERKEGLLRDAHTLLAGILALGAKKHIQDPFLSPELLTEAVKIGLLDAPQLKGSKCALAQIRTIIKHGKCIVADSKNLPIAEHDRVKQFGLDQLEEFEARPFFNHPYVKKEVLL